MLEPRGREHSLAFRQFWSNGQQLHEVPKRVVKSAKSRITAEPDIWSRLAGKQVIVDLSSPFVFVGRFVEMRDGFLALEEVDAHDLRDTSTTRDQYVRQLRLHGINVNRTAAWVRLGEVVAISLLDDVVID